MRDNVMTEDGLRAETFALLNYLEERELSESEAVAVMGFAVNSLIQNSAGLEDFIKALQATYATRRSRTRAKQ